MRASLNPSPARHPSRPGVGTAFPPSLLPFVTSASIKSLARDFGARGGALIAVGPASYSEAFQSFPTRSALFGFVFTPRRRLRAGGERLAGFSRKTVTAPLGTYKYSVCARSCTDYSGGPRKTENKEFVGETLLAVQYR